MRIQKATKGRKQVSACVIKETRKAIEFTAIRFGVSKSFVHSVALAHFFGIKNQQKFSDKK